MDTLRFFLLQHGHLHSLEDGGTASYAGIRVFGGVTDEQMRARPADRVNSLVWLLWHMARPAPSRRTPHVSREWATSRGKATPVPPSSPAPPSGTTRCISVKPSRSAAWLALPVGI